MTTGKLTTLLTLVAEYEGKNIYIREAGNVPFACHRLDHNTGGLTMFAKNGDYFDYITGARLHKGAYQNFIRRSLQAFLRNRPTN